MNTLRNEVVLLNVSMKLLLLLQLFEQTNLSHTLVTKTALNT